MTRCKADGIMKEKNEETDENIWFAKELVPELMEVEKKPPHKVGKKKRLWDEETWVETAVERRLW